MTKTNLSILCQTKIRSRFKTDITLSSYKMLINIKNHRTKIHFVLSLINTMNRSKIYETDIVIY